MKMFEYISAPEAAKKWGISERRVQKLCEENRILGIAKNEPDKAAEYRLCIPVL